MHRSKLSTIVIDCPKETMDAALEFWTGVLGMQAKPMNTDHRYFELEGTLDKVRVLFQAVEDGPAVHLDLATDDMNAEKERVSSLGAEVKKPMKNWVVMTAPSGHVFCVVNNKEPGLLDNAKQWDKP